VSWCITEEKKSELAAALKKIKSKTATASTNDSTPPGTALKPAPAVRPAPTVSQISPQETENLVPSSAEARRSDDSPSKSDSPAPGTALKPAPTVPQISPLETSILVPPSTEAKRPAELSLETPARKRPAKETPAKMCSPVSAAITNLHPQRSKQVLESRSSKSAVPWVEGKSPLNARAVDRNVRTLEAMLAAMASCDTSMASAVLFEVLNRPGLEQVRKLFLSEMRKETDNEQSSKLVDNIKAFICHHPTRASRPQEVQDAVDAILVAATFGPEKYVSLFQIADSFGVSRQIVDKCKERGVDMRATGAAFKPAIVSSNGKLHSTLVARELER
jgi:hypothetical protein